MNDRRSFPELVCGQKLKNAKLKMFRFSQPEFPSRRHSLDLKFYTFAFSTEGLVRFFKVVNSHIH